MVLRIASLAILLHTVGNILVGGLVLEFHRNDGKTVDSYSEVNLIVMISSLSRVTELAHNTEAVLLIELPPL